jgi:hypothetical protein
MQNYEMTEEQTIHRYDIDLMLSKVIAWDERKFRLDENQETLGAN